MATELKSPYILSLDVGTSSTRALLFDSTGATVPDIVSQKQYQLTTSTAGEVSVDADMLVGVVVQTMKEVLQQAGQRKIIAVSIDTFWHSLLGIDASGHPVTPVITWEDTRAYDTAIELRSLLSEKATHDRTGVRFHASYWPAKLRWISQNQPDVFKRVALWISFGEYLHRKLLGRSVCTLSMASATGMLNMRKRQWDEELMHVVGGRPEQFPKIGDVQDSLTGLVPEYASALPALKDLPWFPAIGDGAAACIGSGCSDIENWSMTIGTSSALRVVVEPDRVTPPLGSWLYFIDARRAVIGGALSEGGNLLNWINKNLQMAALKDVEPEIAVLKPDAHGITMLPFISGERSLGWHAEARMTIAGISIHTTPNEVLRASLEALAYQLHAVYQQLYTVLQMDNVEHKLIASGGALLNSQVLQHIIADTIGVSVYPSRDQEASARGAALLALDALGYIPDVARIAPAVLEPTKTNPEFRDVYQKASRRQQSLYQKLLGDQ